MITAAQIIGIIQESISAWHLDSLKRGDDYVIVSEEIKRIRPLGEHRDDLEQVVKELTLTNTEMWHEEDKVRSMKDEVVLKAIRNINPLNQHRNDLIEEIDEIVIDTVAEKGE